MAIKQRHVGVATEIGKALALAGVDTEVVISTARKLAEDKFVAADNQCQYSNTIIAACSDYKPE